LNLIVLIVSHQFLLPQPKNRSRAYELQLTGMSYWYQVLWSIITAFLSPQVQPVSFLTSKYSRQNSVLNIESNENPSATMGVYLTVPESLHRHSNSCCTIPSQYFVCLLL